MLGRFEVLVHEDVYAGEVAHFGSIAEAPDELLDVLHGLLVRLAAHLLYVEGQETGLCDGDLCEKFA